MSENTKEFLNSLGVILLVFTFGIPVIPLAGFALYDSLSKNESTVAKAEAPDSSPEIKVQKPFSEAELVSLINSYRLSNSVSTMLYETTMVSSARANLQDMQAYDYVNTTNPVTQKNGYSFITDRTDSCNYASTIAGNVSGDAQQTFDNLTRNLSIKNSLLDPKYDWYGVATDEKRLTIHTCEKRSVSVPVDYSSNNYSGDLDCEDVGYEHYVGNDDPNGLDGDGDGWACEGW